MTGKKVTTGVSQSRLGHTSWYIMDETQLEGIVVPTIISVGWRPIYSAESWNAM